MEEKTVKILRKINSKGAVVLYEEKFAKEM